jgi:hypothetical protein
MSLIVGLVFVGIFGLQFPNLASATSLIPGPAVLKFGPSESEVSFEASRQAWSASENAASYDRTRFRQAYESTRAKYLPPDWLFWAYMGTCFFGMGLVGLRVWRTVRLFRGTVAAPDWIEGVMKDEDPSGFCRVRLSDRVEVPISWARGQIVLPAGAVAWSREDIQLALRHEVCHVKDGHFKATMGSELLIAFGWFLPWLWCLPRAIRRLAEQAADEAVLHSGSDRLAYAELLLRLGQKKPTWVGGSISMVGSRDLADRIKLVADGRLGGMSWGRRGTYLGFAVGVLGLMPLALSIRSFHQRSSEIDRPWDRSIELTSSNEWQAKDRDGHFVRLKSLVQKRDGRVMEWTRAAGWQKYPHELGLMEGLINRGSVAMSIEVPGWPKIKNDRMYSLSDGNAVAGEGLLGSTIDVQNVARGTATICYSRAEWREVGRLDRGGSATGRLLELPNQRFRTIAKSRDFRAQPGVVERPFLIDYGQIVVPHADVLEFGYDWQAFDRGVTDRRAVFLLRDGRREVAVQWMVEGTPMREVWRAYVPDQEVIGVVMEERPVLRLDISGLPSTS